MQQVLTDRDNDVRPDLPREMWVTGIETFGEARKIQKVLAVDYRTRCGKGVAGFYVAAAGNRLNSRHPIHDLAGEDDEPGWVMPTPDAYPIDPLSVLTLIHQAHGARKKFSVDWDDMSHKWSEHQLRVFHALLTRPESMAVGAVAGSGKTMTIKACVDLVRKRQSEEKTDVRGRVWCLAFNRAIANKINAETIGPNVASTISSAGHRKIEAYFGYDKEKPVNVDERTTLTRKAAERVVIEAVSIPDFDPLIGISGEVLECITTVILSMGDSLVDSIVTLANKRRLTLSDDFDWIISHFNHGDVISSLVVAHEAKSKCVRTVAADGVADWRWATEGELTDILYRLTERVVEERVRQALETHYIEYIDQLWLPARVPEIGKSGPKYDYLFVDECQDLNAAQINIVRNMLADGGRVIAVGDARQAIQGWAGADDSSFENIVREFDALHLPLSISYRCPTSHIALAKEIVPEIEAAPRAGVGEIRDLHPDLLGRTVQPGDLIICRRNAPLWSIGISLIRAGHQVDLRCADIGASLKGIVRKAFRVFYRKDNELALSEILEQMRDEQIAEKEAVGGEFSRIVDTYECLEMIIEGVEDEQGDYEGAILKYIDWVTGKFSAESEDEDGEVKSDVIVVSSIHRAKGSEADRVFIIEPDRMAMIDDRNLDWQNRQEENCKYVGLTRAKKVMFMVKAEDEEKEKGNERKHLVRYA